MFMKIQVFALGFFSATLALNSDEIKPIVGSGCANKVSFVEAFMKDNGATCTTCNYCPGSTLSTIFDPKSSTTCVDCGSNENDCTHFKIITTFDTAWRMWFFSLYSSDASIEHDPKQILVEASDDYDGAEGTWTTLYNSDHYSGSVFSGRGEEKALIFSNDKTYKTYAITFVREDNSSKIQVGNYGIIQAYTKKCASELFQKLTGITVPAQLTSAPTDAPTSKPTSSPTTASPTNIQLSDFFLGCYSDETQNPRDLPHRVSHPADNVDSTKCLQECTQRGYKYMGRQWQNECWCGNTYGHLGTSNGCTDCFKLLNNYGGGVNCVFTTGL